MSKVILIVLLSIGGLFGHFLSTHSVKKVKNIYGLLPLNMLLFFGFFSLYFFAVSEIEAAIGGKFAIYDVEALIFLVFAIVFSIVSSIFHVRSLRKMKKLSKLI